MKESRTGRGVDLGAPLAVRLPADPASAGKARAVIRNWCDEECVGVDLDDVRLAVTEAVANCILHAYPRGHGGVVDVSCHLTDDDLVIEVRDFGVGLTAETTGGLGVGLPVMRRLGHADITPASPGTRVTMRFPTDRRRGAD